MSIDNIIGTSQTMHQVFLKLEADGSEVNTCDLTKRNFSVQDAREQFAVISTQVGIGLTVSAIHPYGTNIAYY